jgi:hypothetical protein
MGKGEEPQVVVAMRGSGSLKLREPSNNDVVPTELEKGLVCVGGYRHGAPTELGEEPGASAATEMTLPSELLNTVHGPYACRRRNEAVHEQTCQE